MRSTCPKGHVSRIQAAAAEVSRRVGFEVAPAEDLSTRVTRVEIGREEVRVVELGEQESFSSDIQCSVVFPFGGRIARLVRRDKSERFARDEVSKHGMSASEDRKR